MVGDSDRHAAALDELIEWWQDLSQKEINSRAVLLPVPPRWGRTYLLNQFAAIVEDDEAVSILVRIRGAALPDGLGLQALVLRKLFSEARVEHRIAERLGVDRLGGATQLGLGMAGLTPFLSPLATQVGLLLAGVGVGAAGKVWDDSLVGQEGMIGKLARAVASVSVSVPVVVIIDDADRLEPDLAVVLLENLIGRFDGQVLAVAAVNPDGDLMSTLISRAKYGLTEGRVRTVDANPGMAYQARVDLAAEMCPTLPNAAIRRIGQRTRTFVEVFAVVSAERLAELDVQGDDAIVTVIDEVTDAEVDRPLREPPSGLAVLLAWAGGVMHTLQAQRAIKVMDQKGLGDDGDVIRFEPLIRLADPDSPRFIERVHILPTSKRHQLANMVLDTALEIGGDPRAGLVDKVVGWQSAHHVRADLQDRTKLVGMQCQLVHGLESLNDLAAAYQVAKTALAEYRASGLGRRRTAQDSELSAAVLRLARTRPSSHADPVVDATVKAVAAGGAAIDLEARIWAAIDLLGQPGKRERALELTDQITAELSQRNDLGIIGNRWRLILAFNVGRAGNPALARQLLAPMLDTPGAPEDGDAARAVLYAVDAPGADTRLQIVGLEAELAALPPDDEDRCLRIHHALAADFGKLGDFRRALHHSQQELPLRRRMQGVDHRDTLTVRNDIAYYTGQCGLWTEAIQLFWDLLPDQERVLGQDHPQTLKTRGNIAFVTGQGGHWTEALQLFQELLPGQERVLGQDHPDTLATRGNIAFCMQYCGRSEDALRVCRALLPDQERVLGQDHPETLVTHNNIALLTAECGHRTEALQLFQDLLRDQVRVLGPDHPDTLRTRYNIAFLTGQCGHPTEALQLFRDLLPDRERVSGRDHPGTLDTRYSIAFWMAECRLWTEALQLFKDVLRDQERVLGPDHPETMKTRHSIQQLNTSSTSADE